MVGEVSGGGLPQPFPDLRNWLVHSLSQRFLEFPQLRHHTIPARLPPELEVAPSGFGTDEYKAEELEGLRFAEPAHLAVSCREAAELDQAGLLRVQRQRKRPQPFAHLLQEAPGFVLMLEAHDDVVGIPDHDHVARGLTPSPACGPEVENVMEIDVREQR